MNVVFLDRDGTIVVEPPDQQVDSLEKLEFIPGVFRGLRLLAERGYTFVIVTNQDGLGTAEYPKQAWEQVQGKILRSLEGEGIVISHVFVCPHFAQDDCSCRKPKTGLVTDFLGKNSIDQTRSFVIGDRDTDIRFGKNIGCRTILLSQVSRTEADFVTSGFLDACNFILQADRSATIQRKTAETNITIDVKLDGSGTSSVSSGIGFFDHMLAQLSKHSGIDLTITVRGDLHVDEHHTIEDTGLALGEAIRRALTDKRGIERYGFVLPMDESLAQVTLDLSGRPYCSFEGTFKRERVGEMPTELVEDFFRAFADGLRANLHVSVRGRNDHHKVEAIFKATARALKQAVARDVEKGTIIPSTKGTL